MAFYARAVTGWPTPQLQAPTLGPHSSKPSAYTDADAIGRDKERKLSAETLSISATGN